MTHCKQFYGLDDSFFNERSCINTAAEIARQPELWNELSKYLLEKKRDIKSFMESLGDKEKLRIILTGAGSSAFIGEALSLCAAKSSSIRSEAVHTTDIVSAPDTVLFADTPTLLVSFARSGNSPESTGAVQYARKKINNLFEAAIVCDPESKLHNITQENKKSLILVMPKGSNDKGFAMTSSVTCMLLAGFALLNYTNIDDIAKDICMLCDHTLDKSLYITEMAQKYSKKYFDRAVYLGSGGNKGLVHEGSLKMMELTNGEINSCFDSATGFRHGPKTVLKDNTLSLHVISNDPFTAQYDIDLLKELYREKSKNMVFAIKPDNKDNIEADDVLDINTSGYGYSADLCYGINALLFFQILSMFKSLELGITTDNPCPGGQVNRVVKGVTVYPL